MAILHIVRNSAFNDNKLNLCLSIISDKDTLFLIDEGVYNIAHPKLIKRLGTIDVYALKEHLVARGLELNDTFIQKADYKLLVELSDNAEKVITWQ